LSILQEFAARAINLTKLESRPTKRGLGDYCFFIDCEGHVADEVVADALRNLAAKQAEVKFLGSYPVGGPTEIGVARRRAAGRAWKHAADWVESLRVQIREPE
jgi:prephenate dehydratase